ncbi:uncharacterized protein ACIBXB_019513 isoform 2-T2 [Morphnus guianensis]
MGLVARGSPGKGCASAVAVPLPQPPAYGSASSLLLLAPVVFCKGFHQNYACSTGTHRRKPRRCRLEIMHRGGGGSATGASHGRVSARSPTRPPPAVGGLGFTAFPGAPGMVAMVSFPWLGVPAGAPPPCPPPSCPPVSGTARPGRLGCRRSHEVAPAPRPHGASPPPGRANPSFPPRHAARHHPTGPRVAGSLRPCSPTPQIPWGSAEGRRSGILLAPETQPERPDLGILLRFGRCRVCRRSAPGQPRAEEVFGYRLGMSAHLGFSAGPCLQPVFGAGAAKEAALASRLSTVGRQQTVFQMSLREPLSGQRPKDSCRASFRSQDVTFPAPPSGSDPVQDPDVPQAIGYTRLHRHPQPENRQLITLNEGLLLGQLWGSAATQHPRLFPARVRLSSLCCNSFTRESVISKPKNGK